MRTVVIKFKKSRNWTNEHPYDTNYSFIRGCYILDLTMDLANKYDGSVCSFRDKDPIDAVKCKIVAKIPEVHKDLFIKDFIKSFNDYIEQVSWR